jgi:uncharacterized membrane protein YccC
LIISIPILFYKKWNEIISSRICGTGSSLFWTALFGYPLPLVAVRVVSVVIRQQFSMKPVHTWAM